MAQIPPILAASVKVMRSHDYCHFEVCLSISFPEPDLASSQQQALEVDALRKMAARLADKAVEQYKIAKELAETKVSAKSQVGFYGPRMEKIRLMAEEDRTIDQKAELKAYDDAQFCASRDYDYEDDYQDDN